MMVEWLFLAVPWGCLWFVFVVFPDHTHLLFSQYTVEPLKFEVLGTDNLISNYQYFELMGGRY